MAALKNVLTGAAGGALGEIAASIVKQGFFAPLMRQIDDLIDLDPNSQDLQAKLQFMKDLLLHIFVNFHNAQRETPKSVEICLERMITAIGEATQLIHRFKGDQSFKNKLISSGQVSEMITRFDQLTGELNTHFEIFLNVSKFVLLPETDVLLQLRPEAGQSSASAPLQETDVLLQPMPEAGLVGKAIGSAVSQLQTLINAEVRVIGVYGMPGVGKTTVLRTLHNSYEVSNFFDVVIWVTVSADYQVLNVQRQIAEAIDLDLSSTSNIDIRRMKLLAHLKKKKFLLILDDIWSPLYLQELGVPFGTNEGSRVVFSTRNRKLALEETNESVELKPLSVDEGWELFEKVAFNGGSDLETFKELARKIADECEGLPLAITVVAKALRSQKTVAEWENSLSKMKFTDPSFPNTHPRIQEELYKKLRWSYNELDKTSHLQDCFLYCAMYPEDEEICLEDLVRMWIAEGFVKSKKGSYSEDMKLGDEYVKRLIDRGLFQSVNFEKQSMNRSVNKPVNVWKKRFIRVHDVIRDMAILTAEEGNNYLCRAGLQLEEFPHSQTQGCKRMSLRRNQVKSLPEDFLCTELVSLLLSENPLGSLPTSLTLLRVLDVSNTQIKSVPTSLTHLQFLRMKHTCIQELPKDIGNLSNLQFLDISDCEYLTSLPTEISQLTSLKRLHLSMGWKNAVEDPKNVMALTGLKNLRELHLYMFFKFERHEIMGTIFGSWVEMRHLYLHYNHLDAAKCNLPQGMQNMKKLESLVLSEYGGTKLPDLICEFKELERLELDSCSNVTQLPPLQRLSKLKFLKIRRCHKVKDLGVEKSSGFPELEVLHLSEMSKMSKLGVLNEETLPKLRVLKIKKCGRLRKLPTGMEKLSHLKALYGHKTWWNNLIWEDHHMKICLEDKDLFEEI